MFVWCCHYTLSYSEEFPEDGPDEVYYLLEPADIGSGNTALRGFREDQSTGPAAAQLFFCKFAGVGRVG